MGVEGAVTAQAAAKRRGAAFELALVEYARSKGFPAERLRLAGRNDEGDVAVQDDRFTYVLEAKAERSPDFSAAVREALVEEKNYAKARGLDPADVQGVAVIKRPGKSIGESYVITTLDEFLR